MVESGQLTGILQNRVPLYELPSHQIWVHTVMLKYFDLRQTDLADQRACSSDDPYLSIGEIRFWNSWFIFELWRQQADRQTDTSDILFNLLNRKLISSIKTLLNNSITKALLTIHLIILLRVQDSDNEIPDNEPDQDMSDDHSSDTELNHLDEHSSSPDIDPQPLALPMNEYNANTYFDSYTPGDYMSIQCRSPA